MGPSGAVPHVQKIDKYVGVKVFLFKESLNKRNLLIAQEEDPFIPIKIVKNRFLIEKIDFFGNF